MRFQVILLDFREIFDRFEEQTKIARLMNQNNSNRADGGNGFSDDEHADLPGKQSRDDHRLDALDRILSSKHFRASERNKQFLKFVVEETVAGRASRIKAFTVAVDVFGRDASFDASVDPIVRIAAGHLRRSLEDYYAGPGKRDPYRIVLPLGTYVPVFVRQETLPERAVSRLRDILLERRPSLQSGTVSVTLALAGAFLGAAYFMGSFETSNQRSEPVIVVAQVQAYSSAGEESENFARLFTQSLWEAMSGVEGFRIVGVKPDEQLRDVLTKVDERFDKAAGVYQLLSAVRQEGGQWQVFWHLLDGRTNESYLSTSTIREAGDISSAQVSAELAHEVARSVQKFSRPASRESAM
ncbi:hypothetical protein [Chelativorans composti]|uniref:Uncharacterized protein n=1 Tax=Chelativorans composti TaxID=768533 RepID=A0ABW5DE12_9HYPH